MNSYGYERGGPARVNGLASNGGFDHYRDDYGRDDLRRDEDDRYPRGVRNGGPSFDRFNTDYLDQNSLSDFRSNEPKFELDHLATFAAGTRNGVIHAEDGLRKLRQMENTTGIWTMRCLLFVERNYLLILDNSTGEELERFPIQLVQDPTAVFKNDRREIYNNLILFTVIDDPKKRSSQADMHIFQSSKAPAQEIVDEILAAKNGQQRLYQGGGAIVIYQHNTNKYRNYRPKIPPPPVGRAPEPPANAYNFQDMRQFLDSRQYETNTTTEVQRFNQFNQTSYSHGGDFGGPIGQQRSLITRINTVRERENIEGGSTEILERDVQLLNHCFDDIEKFVARLQQAAESYKELEKRKRDRGAKNKKKQSGDGMLNARARPPPDQDFVDIFQKFKLSFNLLAKLKAHIHDPNAPELVHFLFTPLSLIYEASRDPFHGNQNLGDQAVPPVLTGEAKQLLLNCLTSKEIELWQALGKHWTTSRDEWQGHIPPYVPEFYDGWRPTAAVIDEMAHRTAIMAAPLPMIEPARTQLAIEDRPRGYANPPQRPKAFPDDDRPVVDRYHRPDDFERFEPEPARGFRPLQEPSNSRGYEPRASWGQGPPQGYEARAFERSPPRSGMGSPYSSDFIETHHVERNVRAEIPKPDRDHLPSGGGLSRQDENNAYYEELRRQGDTTIYEAAHDRVGKNVKELTLQRGDIVQVLDSSKNWWKLRNYKGQVGFAPYTILKAMKESYN
jgi:epidermal growth factor receptor kinase substrate 8